MSDDLLYIQSSGNDDLIELYEYRDTEVYKEIVLFLNDFNPDWRKNKELGSWAPEFCLRYIKLYEDSLHDRKEDTFIGWAANLFEDIAEYYYKTKTDYQFIRKQLLLNRFEEFLESKYGLGEIDEVLWNKEWAGFEKADDEKISFSF